MPAAGGGAQLKIDLLSLSHNRLGQGEKEGSVTILGVLVLGEIESNRTSKSQRTHAAGMDEEGEKSDG